MSQSVATAADSKPAARSRPGIDHHPPALYVLFATEMWERFGFYTMAAVMTLFLQDKVQGFGWTRDQATGLWSYYLMFVYLTPFLGGLHRRPVIWATGGRSSSAGSSSSRVTSCWPWARWPHSMWRWCSSSSATASSSPISRRSSATSTRRAARFATRPTTSSTWASTSAPFWRRSSPRSCGRRSASGPRSSRPGWAWRWAR